MNKVLRIISIVLLGGLAAAMFLMWTPISDDSSVITYAIYSKELKLVLPGLLFLSGIVCFRSAGFKVRRAFRIVIAIIAIILGVLAMVLPNTVTKRDNIEVYAKFVMLAIGYAVVFLLLFIMHLTELGSRRGIAKIFAPFADIAMMVFVFALYISIAVPLATKTTFGQYTEYAVKYGNYVCGGLLAAEFVFAFIELFTRKKA